MIRFRRIRVFVAGACCSGMVYALWREGCIYEEGDYVARLAETAKKTVSTSGTIQDQKAEARLSNR